MKGMLPKSEKLNIADLQRIFDDKSECYKLFWFKAIIRKVKEGQQSMSYNELISLMMSDAYFMVNEYHLNLGPNDSLEKIVKIIHRQTGINASEKIEKIYEKLLEYRNSEITTLRSNLIANVPYCLQSCFLHGIKLDDISSRKKQRIYELNQQKRLMYYYSEYNQYETNIIISDDWFDYFSENREIIEGWIQYNIIEYLQRRNPTIPGIPNKIAPPEKRDLSHAKKFWKTVISKVEIRDCYTGIVLDSHNMDKYGRMEIDHFIPWSFIASDEVWNLTPTFKLINGSKSNDLPDLVVDLELMAYQHHKALAVAAENKQIRKLLKTYLDNNLNDSQTRLYLYENLISKEKYKDGIYKIIEPIYMSAQNVGYKQWNKKVEV